MVELMFNKELSDITFDIDDLQEWKDIAIQLGMEKQISLTKGKDTPIPYPYMNEVMFRVYQTLCPNKIDYKEYKNTTVPLDVMKQIFFCVKENYFQKIEIWADDKEPDPLVVGYLGKYWDNAKDNDGNRLYFNTKEECLAHSDNKNAYFSEEGKYLIARWGDELRSFAELKGKALQRLIDSTSIELQRELAEKTERLKLIKENCASYLEEHISLYNIK